MSEEETRDDIIDIINNEEPVACVSEAPQEEIKEEVKEKEIKPKAKAKSKSRAKPKIKIVKESVEPVEPIVVEPVVGPIVVVEEKPAPVKVDKLKKIVQCTDCGFSMTQHTLLYVHKRRGFCKAVVKEEPEARVSCAPPPKPTVQPKPKITQDIVIDIIKENPDIVSNYLRNERAMKAQRKQMNARS